MMHVTEGMVTGCVEIFGCQREGSPFSANLPELAILKREAQLLFVPLVSSAVQYFGRMAGILLLDPCGLRPCW